MRVYMYLFLVCYVATENKLETINVTKYDVTFATNVPQTP